MMDELFWAVDEVFMLPISTIYSYVEFILRIARIYHSELGISKPIHGMFHEHILFEQYNGKDLENFFFGEAFKWHTAFHSNLSPPPLP
jgi:hypothetical protein